MTHVAFQNNTLNLPPQKEVSSIGEFENSSITHEKINRCLTDINQCLTDIFKI